MEWIANLPSSCPTDASSLESCISALKSSISALESSIRTTEGSSGRWETFGWLCAIIVGIGVAGEIVAIVLEHRDRLTDWRRGIVEMTLQIVPSGMSFPCAYRMIAGFNQLIIIELRRACAICVEMPASTLGGEPVDIMRACVIFKQFRFSEAARSR